jgi:hypothetical protein
LYVCGVPQEYSDAASLQAQTWQLTVTVYLDAVAGAQVSLRFGLFTDFAKSDSLSTHWLAVLLALCPESRSVPVHTASPN